MMGVEERAGEVPGPARAAAAPRRWRLPSVRIPWLVLPRLRFLAALAPLWRGKAGLVTGGVAALLFAAAALALLLRSASLSPERYADDLPGDRPERPAAAGAEDPFKADRAIAADLIAARQAAMPKSAPPARTTERIQAQPRTPASEVAAASASRKRAAPAEHTDRQTLANRSSLPMMARRVSPPTTPGSAPTAAPRVLAARAPAPVASISVTPPAAVALVTGVIDDPLSNRDRSLRALRQDATDALRTIRLR